jgi:hypothetical protein
VISQFKSFFPYAATGVYGMTSNVLLVMYAVGMVTSGWFYAHKLKSLMGGGAIKDERRKRAINSIVHTVYAAMTLAIVTLIAIGLNLKFGVYPDPVYTIWGWWLVLIL